MRVRVGGESGAAGGGGGREDKKKKASGEMRDGQWRRGTMRRFPTPLPTTSASAQHPAIRRRHRASGTEMRMYALELGHDTAPFFPQGSPSEVPRGCTADIGVAWSFDSLGTLETCELGIASVRHWLARRIAPFVSINANIQ